VRRYTVPYRKVEFAAGEYYHVYNRGNNYSPVFFEHENYLYFLRQMRKYLTSDVLTVIAYCLMPNHYHLLVRLNCDDPSRPMQRFLLSYTKAINQRYNRVGSLFQGRFKAIRVDRDEYLLDLSRYIHLNPVMADLVQRAEDWEFSSYREFVGLRAGTLPVPQVVLCQFPSVDAYRSFVGSYKDDDRKRVEHLVFE
jgi:REP element-mobilizing transposase RayT